AGFASQVNAIWEAQSPKRFTVAGLVDAALNQAPLVTSETLLLQAMDAMAEDGEYNLSYVGAATQRLDRMGNEWFERIGEKARQAAENAPAGVAEVLQGIH